MKGRKTMKSLLLMQEKLTVTGPMHEIDSLEIYLRNKFQSVEVIKSSAHFPPWNSFKDLYIAVPGEELEEVVGKICDRLESGSIHRGWIDYSQTLQPICSHNKPKENLLSLYR